MMALFLSTTSVASKIVTIESSTSADAALKDAEREASVSIPEASDSRPAATSAAPTPGRVSGSSGGLKEHVPPVVSLIIRVAPSRADIERLATSQELAWYFDDSQDGGYIIAQVHIDTATGTGVHLEWLGTEGSRVVPKHQHTYEINSRVFSRATASMMPLQHVLELALIPLGVRFEAPDADYGYRCGANGHLKASGDASQLASRCAMRFPAGLGAKTNHGFQHKPNESHELTAIDLASSLWDLLERSRFIKDEMVILEDTTLVISGLRLDTEEAEPRKPASWWSSVPKLKPRPIDFEELEEFHNREATTTFRNELMECRAPPCAATGRRSADSSDMSIDAVYSIEVSKGQVVFNHVITELFSNSFSEYSSMKGRCRPLFSSTRIVPFGTLNDAGSNGIVLDKSAGDAFLRETIWMLDGEFYVTVRMRR